MDEAQSIKVNQLITYQSVWDVHRAAASARWISSVLADVEIIDNPRPQDLKKLMLESIQKKCANVSEFSVPLSVGCDSRFIYACLREFVESDKIFAVTFGQPGNYEYEFSRYLFKRVIPNHKRLDFSQYTWCAERIVDLIKKNGAAAAWNWPPCIAELNGRVLHGYMGDPLAASRLPSKLSSSISGALRHLHKKDHTTLSRDLGLGESMGERLSDALEKSLIKSNETNLDLVIDYSLRQDQRIRPRYLENGGDENFPFLDKELIRFMWSVPHSKKADEAWYMSSLKGLFPDLYWDLRVFQVGNKTQYQNRLNVAKAWGRIRSIWGAPKSVTTMYNWGHEILKNPSLFSLVSEQLHDLMSRKLDLVLDVSNLIKMLGSRNEQFIRSNYSHYHLATYIELNMKAGTL